MIIWDFSAISNGKASICYCISLIMDTIHLAIKVMMIGFKINYPEYIDAVYEVIMEVCLVIYCWTKTTLGMSTIGHHST